MAWVNSVLDRQDSSVKVEWVWALSPHNSVLINSANSDLGKVVWACLQAWALVACLNLVLDLKDSSVKDHQWAWVLDPHNSALISSAHSDLEASHFWVVNSDKTNSLVCQVLETLCCNQVLEINSSVLDHQLDLDLYMVNHPLVLAANHHSADCKALGNSASLTSSALCNHHLELKTHSMVCQAWATQ